MEKRFTIINITTLVIGALIWISHSGSQEPILILTAIIIHEAAHVCAAMLYRKRFDKFSFQAGGLRLMSKSSFSSYQSEAVIALSGPLANIFCYFLFKKTSLYTAEYFSHVSAALAFLNLLPIRGFDGSKVTEAVLSYFLSVNAALKICNILSFLSLFAVWCTAIYIMLKTGRNTSTFFFSVMIFLRIIFDSRKSRQI